MIFCVASAATAWWVAGALGTLLLWHLAGTWWVRLRRRFGIKSRQQRALRGERAAERLLQSRGYAVEDAQVTHSYVLRCDGEPHSVQVRGDYLVCRGGRRYLAEVKTGTDAPRLTSAATRRQLLEYAHAYDVDGVLLVDMSAGEIRHIAFPAAHPGPRGALRLALALGLGCLLGLGLHQLLAAG
jgi:hypothetical protein